MEISSSDSVVVHGSGRCEELYLPIAFRYITFTPDIVTFTPDIGHIQHHVVNIKCLYNLSLILYAVTMCYVTRDHAVYSPKVCMQVGISLHTPFRAWMHDL